MKKLHTIFNRHALYSLIFILSVTVFSCTNKATTTQQDVQDDVEEAREATQEAEEKAQQAVDTREELARDQRAVQLKELEERNDAIEGRISELRETAEKTQNQDAVSEIESAITEMEKDKEEINVNMEQIQSLEHKDWSNTYDNINEAIEQIEQEIDRVSESLSDTN